jgi:flavin-dependent dehydrogenase
VLSKGRAIGAVEWRAERRAVTIEAPGGVAIMRSEFDAALVAAAVERGCLFVPGASATLMSSDERDAKRTIRLQSGGKISHIQAAAVLACDGIGGGSVAGEPWAQWRVVHGAWMGVSHTAVEWPDDIAAGCIQMQVGHGGYVGLVRMNDSRMNDSRVHLAAAIDPRICKISGGPGKLIGAILESCGRSFSGELNAARFDGVGLLTRRRDQIGGHRVLAVGDACGYVEPFTGEGMSWALQSARLAVDLLPEGSGEWPKELAARWHMIYGYAIRRRQRLCLALRPILHRPWLASIAIGAGRIAPALGELLAERVTGSRRVVAAAQGEIA